MLTQSSLFISLLAYSQG